VLTLLDGGFSNRVRAEPAVDTGPPPAQAAPAGRTAPPESAASVPPEVRDWQRQIHLLRQQGRYGQAAALQERELAWTEKHYGPEHPSTATSLHNLAKMYGKQGTYARAEPLSLRAVAIREKVLGPNHPDTAASLNNLADLY
jgi:hypothetical protein